MRRNPKYSKELKIKACKDYDEGNGSFVDIAEKIWISKEVVRRWYLKYKVHGPSALETLSKNRSYSKVFKLTVVEEFTTGKYSLTDLSAKYNIVGI
ncbi:MAG: transposase [Sedimentibacter sp.]